MLPAISREGIPAEDLLRAGGRHARDLQAGGEADDGNGQRHDAHPPGIGFPDREEDAAARDAEHDRDEGAHFEQRVAARKIAIGNHLRHDAVFRRAEDGGVQSHQEDHREHAFRPAAQQRGQAEQHDGDFEDLDADQDAALADQVGQVAGVPAEQAARAA